MPTIRITTEETHGKLMVAEEALGAILSFDLTTFLQASSIFLLISSFFFFRLRPQAAVGRVECLRNCRSMSLLRNS